MRLGAVPAQVPEIAKVISEVQKTNSLPFVYWMFVFVAHTGARRSEIPGSRIEDFDFDTRIVKIREKKKVIRPSGAGVRGFNEIAIGMHSPFK